ncbi:MAG TPA: dienelactone hydrolase family protein [Longimicrobium sp.]|nr:dienelactone hydrolase family protein [Longimicrobium sp.]
MRILPCSLALLALAACASNRASGDGEREHVDAMAREHAEHTPVANASSLEPRVPVVTQEVPYMVDGEMVRGYEARPAGTGPAQKLPSLIVIHEWWGLNDNVKMMTRRLAGEGYRALAVDMYHGRATADPQQARALMMEVMQDGDRGAMHIATAELYLRDQTDADRIGIIGWCFGGGWALQGALELPERIDAAVMYYGMVTADRARLARLRGPLLGIFAEDDQAIPVDSVRAMEAALRELGKPATIRVYEDAQHGFANPSGQAYLPEPAADAWNRTVAFFAQHLKGGR